MHKLLSSRRGRHLNLAAVNLLHDLNPDLPAPSRTACAGGSVLRAGRDGGLATSERGALKMGPMQLRNWILDFIS